MVRIIEKRVGKHTVDQDFLSLHYVLKVRGCDNTRPALKCLHVSSGMIMASDGYRLHIATVDYDLADGVYEVLTAKKDMVILRAIDYQSPDFMAVWPTKTHNGIDPFYVPDRKSILSKDTVVLNKILRKSDMGFNPKYLLDACLEGDYIHVRQGEIGKYPPIEIRNAYNSEDVTRAAIIMPVIID